KKLPGRSENLGSCLAMVEVADLFSTGFPCRLSLDRLAAKQVMPIYEFACPKCRVIFNFLSKRLQPISTPKCPKCGNQRMIKQMSTFAMPSGAPEPGSADPGADGPVPDMDDPRVGRAMAEMEHDMATLDENNPRHVAQ